MAFQVIVVKGAASVLTDGAAGAATEIKLRLLLHSPGVPPLFSARTRQEICPPGTVSAGAS